MKRDGQCPFSYQVLRHREQNDPKKILLFTC